MSHLIRCVVCLTLLSVAPGAVGQSVVNHKYGQPDKFRQLDEVLPTPNSMRTASGAPGHEYWQQKVDYDIDVTLDDEKQRISGQETITYHNDSLSYQQYYYLVSHA